MDHKIIILQNPWKYKTRNNTDMDAIRTQSVWFDRNDSRYYRQKYI